MSQIITFTIAAFFGVALLNACTNHDIGDPSVLNETDSTLFNQTQNGDFTYYQNGNIISPASESPHGFFKLRFNDIATNALDNTGELPSGGQFPGGSIIVKEVYQNSNLALLAVMKKAPTDASAGGGWLWAEYQLDGRQIISINGRGAACTNCHGDTPNRDLVRTFDLH